MQVLEEGDPVAAGLSCNHCAGVIAFLLQISVLMAEMVQPAAGFHAENQGLRGLNSEKPAKR